VSVALVVVRPSWAPGQHDLAVSELVLDHQPARDSTQAGSLAKGGPRTTGALLRAMRPRQWVKNLLVFVAPAAAGVLGHGHVALETFGAGALFCAASSGTYLFNDVVDAEADRRHPQKHRRPIASGALGVKGALAAASVLVASSVTGAQLLGGWPLFGVLAVYVTVSLTYSLGLKNQPVLELAAVAAGFVLRAIAGGAATHVPLSSWFLAVTSFGALFIVTGKRVAEHRALGDARDLHRRVLAQYTRSFLQSTLTLTAAATVTTYCLWAFERAGLMSSAAHHKVWIQLTVVPFTIAVLHVLRVLDAGAGAAPEDLAFADRILQFLGVLWVLCFAIGIYG